MPQLWKFKPIEDSTVQAVADFTGLPMPLARALALRGHHTPDEINTFLDPRLAGLSDPFLLPDMEKAVGRLWTAIDAGETITIFGDYDVDGITSSAVLVRMLSVLGADVRPFIPDRLDEGYGLSQDALDRCLAEHGSTLVVTVDCGTNSVDSMAHAQAHGVDVIVTDHHEPDAEIADAFALINPKLGTVPELEILAGVGVAFKLSHALLKTGRERGSVAAQQTDLRDYLDIAALGTAADLVPLVAENRIIVRHGLMKLDQTKWEGLRALKAVAGLRGEADTYHLGFQLGPRINAAGRIGQPMQALRLLTTDDSGEAREIADLLDRTNVERRKIEHDMAEEAFAEIDGYFDPEKNFGLVIAKKGWHPGVVGIVASRVAHHYNRPAILMGIGSEGKVRGSCRSIDAYDLLEGLQACEEHLATFGGHKMAAGLEVKPGALDVFKQDFNAEVASALDGVDIAPVQYIDAELAGDDLDWKFYEQLKKLSPFGQANSEPIWALRRIKLSDPPRVVGKKHLKLSIMTSGGKFDAIIFNYSAEQLPDGPLDLAFTLKENTWNGNTTLQLQIKDIRPASVELN